MAIKSDLQWQAEDDARTMARYQEIMSDKARLKRVNFADAVFEAQHRTPEEAEE